MTESFVYVLFAIAFVLGMLDYDGMGSKMA